MTTHDDHSGSKYLGATDFDKWKHRSLKFSEGDMVKITQIPYYEDIDNVGKIGIIIKRTTTYGELAPLYWDVLIEGKIRPVHYKNMRKIEEDKNESSNLQSP